MAKVVRLWIREDGEQPKAIAADGTLPPGPGRVVDVRARSAEHARQLFAVAELPEPDRTKDRSGWLSREEAIERVKRVATVARNEKGALVRAEVTRGPG